MKKSFFVTVIFTIMVANLFSQSSGNRIAILNLDAVGVSGNESITLTDRMRSELVSSGAFAVIERSEMNEILKEQGFQQSGCTSDECAVEIGKLLNINLICAGSVGKVGSLYTVTLRMINVETGEILVTVNEDCKCPIEDVLTISMKNVAQKLVTASKGLVRITVSGKGDIYIKSNPTGASVHVDGRKTGETTPITIRDIDSGAHLVKAVKGDFVGSKVVNVQANVITEANITLGKAKGGLKVYSTPAEANIYIGEQYYGNTPKVINEIAAGDHLIILKKPGYIDVKQRVTVAGEKFTNVEGELVKPASLYISSTPSKATVNIRGQKMGETPLSINDLYPEKVYVEVSVPGYQTERRYVQLREAFSANERFELKKLPSIYVESKPSGARVYVNDNFKGMTPVKIESITEERVNIEVKKQYHGDWKRDLTLVVGRDEKLIANLTGKNCNLQIMSTPGGAAVKLNGKRVGKTPYITSMSYGEYSVSLSDPKFETISEKIILDAPKIKKNFKMVYRKGILKLNNLAKGASVFIDNKGSMLNIVGN